MRALFGGISRTLRKNWPELKALASFEMPDFIYGKTRFRDIPVFCFHEARMPMLERQLRFLRRNGYRTLVAHELMERLADPGYRNDGRDIVLTFDDAMTSVWTVGFPLLQKYECRIILFAISGLVSEGNAPRPHDGASDSAAAPGDTSPLCNWEELRRMSSSGLVDVQSHGVSHSLISIGPEVADFVNPSFDPYYYGNIHVPAYDGGNGTLVREAHSGHLVYRSASRFSRHRRYIDAAGVRDRCAEFVADEGGAEFFRRPDWREKLQAFHHGLLGAEEPVYENDDERLDAIRTELHESRRALGSRLGIDSIDHFCLPWFAGSDDAYRLAGEEGYKAIHVGPVPDFAAVSADGRPAIVKRIGEEYLLTLPGEGRSSMFGILNAKRDLRRQSENMKASRLEQTAMT